MSAEDFILVLNGGSSSLKFALFDVNRELRLKLNGQIAGIGAAASFQLAGKEHPIDPGVSHDGAIAEAFAAVDSVRDSIKAIGHRIVHGGDLYTAAAVIDDAVFENLRSLQRLAPLHMPPCLAVIDAARQRFPAVPNVGCFDTAFHATQTELATRLPLPVEFHQCGYRRYGFHGLNYEHVVRALPELTGTPLPRRLIVAHLGQGASLCAIFEGKSIATTMGYSTADGLIMGTRSGSIDPGVLVALVRDEGFDAARLEALLYRESGLLALSGLSGDMKALIEANTTASRNAIDHYCYAAARHAASLAAALGGLDAMAFTGGVGENAAVIRDGILSRLSWINPRFDVHVVAANEERVMAGQVQSLVF